MRDVRPPILVVEDENVVAMDLVSSLEKLRYPVIGVAASGEEAVAMAQESSPGLVLMDIHLRGKMDGVHAAERIQGELFIPVVYLTAYSDRATLDRARITHPYGYVLKPFDDREIEVAIQIALFRHDMERALRDSERRLDAILSSIGEAVIATDATRRVTFLNRAAEALLGWTSGRAKGRLLSDVLRYSQHSDGVLRLVRDRGLVPIEVVESSVLDASGTPTGYVTVARDISERLNAQQARDRELVERAAREAAQKEHERVRLTSEISLSLADITQPSDMLVALRRVAALIVQNFAGWCVLHVDDRPRFLPIAAHADPAKCAWAEDLLRRWPPDPEAPRGVYAVMRTGRPEILETISDELLAELARDPEHLEMLRALGATSYICVPLQARQRTIGAISFVSTESTSRYTEADVAFAQQVADRIAVALENTRLYHEAQEARTTAERLYEAEQKARTEAEALFRLADTLSQAQFNLEMLVQRVTDEATSLVGAQFGAFFYNVVNEHGEAYKLYTLSGAPKEAFERFGLPRNTPIFAPTFDGTGVVRLDDVRKDPRYGKLAPHYGMPEGHLPVASYLAVPVVSRTGPVIGGLFFGHPEPGRFKEQHERVARALAAHAAVAMDNARLFQATRDAEERQGRLVRQLERAVRFSEMFVGILGHDLRNPLSGIMSAATLALRRGDPERVATPLGRILRSAERMSRMIDQILDFTHVRLGRGIPLERKLVDLAEICRLVIDELSSGPENTIDVQLEVRGSPAGSWDGDRLAQLVSNLAGNAVQHRSAGTPVVLVIDGSQPENVTLEIQNEGVIPPEILPFIFEPLQGGEHRKHERSSGLGLGLYISQQIAIAHGGAIGLASDSAEGRTRFRVTLPRAPLDESTQVFGSQSREEDPT